MQSIVNHKRGYEAAALYEQTNIAATASASAFVAYIIEFII